jgi:hypothetical protein
MHLIVELLGTDDNGASRGPCLARVVGRSALAGGQHHSGCSAARQWDVMDVADKLQLKPESSLTILGAPRGLQTKLADGIRRRRDAAQADAVLAFAASAADLTGVAAPALAAAREDRLAWIAYPKAGQLGTDLNRERLAIAARDHGVQPVRQVSIDEVWSALRFRPI